MKIYISEKDVLPTDLALLDYCNLNEKGFYKQRKKALVKINSLEQHEAEIRKPLEDEIERLKETIRIIDNDTTDGRVKVLKSYVKRLQKDINEIWSEYLENAPNINIEEKELLKRKERQKVIAELEEWADNNTDEDEGYYGHKFYTMDRDSLKQKLNEMKEVEK